MTLDRDQFRAAYKNAPRAVRNYLAGTELDTLMFSLANSYGLHADTAGQVSDAITQLLLGLIDPQAFSQQLRWFGLDEAKVGQVVQEINEKVFKPIQARMKSGEDDDTDAFLDNAVPADVPVVPASQPPPRPVAPTWMPPAPPRPITPKVAPAYPAPTVSFGSPPTASVPVAPTRVSAPPPNLPGTDLPPEPTPAFRTMQTDFPQGAAPQRAASIAPTSTPAPVRFNEAPAAPTPAPAPIPAPKPMPPPPAAPQFVPPPQPTAPSIRPNMMPPVQTSAPQPLKKYGVDPYREPVE